MQCPKCGEDNREGKKFCAHCGGKLENICPNCQSLNLVASRFCDECGYELTKTKAILQQEPTISQERKHVTVLFSDLSGYTSMSEKLDPEELKEIMDRIFGKISQIVVKYEGFIEKFVGDAVMAIFGVPKTHEDDPVRAIRTAREIHNLVKEISPSIEKTTGRPLYMHTGINTGLVVAKELDFDKGTHGVLGDTINVASRISGLAKADEIIIGLETYHQAEGYFNFEKLRSTKVKGKEEPIPIFKVLSAKEAPSKTHRLSGLRSELIGRRAEMSLLKEAVENLKKGQSSVFSIIGDAGTGKSRLVEDFRSTLNLNEIQWREGHSYAYSQNIAYFPLVDLMDRAWQIREGDHKEQVKQKMEKGAKALLRDRLDLLPFIGSLYSIPYPELEQTPPEQIRAKLQEGIQLLLANLCKRAPAIICIEDLHWADPSSVELLRKTLGNLKFPAIFLCLYRPSFSLFTSQQMSGIRYYNEIRLQDLTPTDAQDMVESLLKTKTIPQQLQMFIREKAEGNPFYLEEVINSLIETDTLVKEKTTWKLIRTPTEQDIPKTVQGVISARLDRLERETKRILQEASVIGRAFLYDILTRVSELRDYIDKSLMNLERLDLIKTRSFQPEIEYIFKHALAQEVVYNGILIKERKQLHEKIGSVMEQLFQDRLNEFYETIAYHYAQSDNYRKAYEYLKLAIDKAAKSYANQEAINLYEEALKILKDPPETDEIKRWQVELCCSIYHSLAYLSYPVGSIEILQNGEKLAQELGDENCRGKILNTLSNYYTVSGNASLGLEYAEKCFTSAEKNRDFGLMAGSAAMISTAYFYASEAAKAVNIGSRTINLLEEYHPERNISLIRGYESACSAIYAFYGGSLGWIGRIQEGIEILEKGFSFASEINDKFGMGFMKMFQSTLTYMAGDADKTINHAQESIKIFEEAQVFLSLQTSWSCLGGGYYLLGEYEKAIHAGEKAIKLAKELGLPFNASWCYCFQAESLRAAGDLGRARECAQEGLRSAQECNSKGVESYARIILGCLTEEITSTAIEKAENEIRNGISILEDLELKPPSAIGHLFLGEFLANANKKKEALDIFKKTEAMCLEMKMTPKSYWLRRTQEYIKILEA